MKVSLRNWLREIEENWKNVPEFKVPKGKLTHLAIICDGNRRAARERGLSPYFGHRAGVETIKEVARVCRRWGICHLTFWTWSTENWKREKKQIDYIMNLAVKFLADQGFKKELVKNKVRFTHFGRKDRLPLKVLGALADWEDKTKDFSRYWLNSAMDYGGEDEVTRACFSAMQAGVAPKEMKKNPSLIRKFLDTNGQPDPDLVLRTGTKEGEISHTSGFLPLQSAYSGWLFVSDLLPELTPEKLLSSIKEFLKYERRFGS